MTKICYPMQIYHSSSLWQEANMIVKNWVILGVAVSAILAYTVGIPPSFAEYSKSAQYTSSANSLWKY